MLPSRQVSYLKSVLPFVNTSVMKAVIFLNVLFLGQVSLFKLSLCNSWSTLNYLGKLAGSEGGSYFLSILPPMHIPHFVQLLDIGIVSTFGYSE
jgi:hypothetical protein